jgi:hypothetical protein
MRAPLARDCKANQETDSIYSKPFPTPLDSDVRAFARKSERYVARRVQLNPGIFPYVSTANVARATWTGCTRPSATTS